MVAREDDRSVQVGSVDPQGAGARMFGAQITPRMKVVKR